MNPKTTVWFGAKGSLQGSDGIEIFRSLLLELSATGGNLFWKVEEGYYVPLPGTPRLFQASHATTPSEVETVMASLGSVLQRILPAAMRRSEAVQRFELPDYVRRAYQDGFDCLFPASDSETYLEAFVLGFTVRLDHLLRFDRTSHEVLTRSLAWKTALSLPACLTNSEAPTLRRLHGLPRAA